MSFEEIKGIAAPMWRCRSCNCIVFDPQTQHYCPATPHVIGAVEAKPLTEADIRRIVREEIARATRQPHVGASNSIAGEQHAE